MSTLAREMRAAVRRAASVHIHGSGLPGIGGIDVTITRSGDLSGTVGASGATVSLLARGGRSYVRVDAAFLRLARAPQPLCAAMCGKWVAGPPSLTHGLTAVVNWQDIVSKFPDTAGLRTRYAGTATVNGQPVWKLVGPRGGTVYVSARGPAYVLAATSLPGLPGTFQFLGWDRATVPAPPPRSQVVSLSQLGL